MRTDAFAPYIIHFMKSAKLVHWMCNGVGCALTKMWIWLVGISTKFESYRRANGNRWQCTNYAMKLNRSRECYLICTLYISINQYLLEVERCDFFYTDRLSSLLALLTTMLMLSKETKGEKNLPKIKSVINLSLLRMPHPFHGYVVASNIREMPIQCERESLILQLRATWRNSIHQISSRSTCAERHTYGLLLFFWQNNEISERTLTTHSHWQESMRLLFFVKIGRRCWSVTTLVPISRYPPCWNVNVRSIR